VQRNQRIGRCSSGALAAAVVTAALGALAAGAQAVTLSPLNGTPDASPDTQISFLGAPAGQIADVSVEGSRSGSHGGKLRSYASASGASFVPSRRCSRRRSGSRRARRRRPAATSS